MNLAKLDELQARLQRVGIAGSLPKGASPELVVDEIQRHLGSLADAMRAVLEELRAAPGFGKGSNLFLIDARTGYTTNNVLTTAQASREGYGTTAGLAIYRHGKGYKLDRHETIYFALNSRSVTVVNGQQQRSGAVVIYAFDENKTVFQLDNDAEVQQAVLVVSCFPSRVIPSAANRGREQQTGASTTQLGLVTAGSVADLP